MSFITELFVCVGGFVPYFDNVQWRYW